MINVTESAASKITELLAEENKPGAGLRVFVQGGGCSGFQYGLMIDEGEGDATPTRCSRSNGVKLLRRPDQRSVPHGAEVDFVDNITGGGFTIKNPNAKSTCGCGVVVHASNGPCASPRRRGRAQRTGWTPLRLTSTAAARRRQALRQARPHRQRLPAAGRAPQRRRARRSDPP